MSADEVQAATDVMQTVCIVALFVLALRRPSK